METFSNWPSTLVIVGAAVLSSFIVGVFAVIGRRASILMKLGLRNVPRRPVRAGLIVFGLMLSTTVVGSAFATGDIMSYTLRSVVTENLGTVDEVILINPPRPDRGEQLRSLGSGGFGGLPSENLYFFSDRNVDPVLEVAERSDNISAVVGGVLDRITIVQPGQQELQSSVMLLAVPLPYPQEFGQFALADQTGSVPPPLESGEVFVNAAAAEEFGIQAGDPIDIHTWENRFAAGGPWHARVKDVVQNNGIVGAQPAIIAEISQYQVVIGRESLINVILVANEGGVNSVERSQAAASELRAPLADREAAQGLFDILSTPAAQQLMLDAEQTLDDEDRERLALLRIEATQPTMTDQFVSYISQPQMRYGLSFLVRQIPSRVDRSAAYEHLRDLANLWVLEVKAQGMDEAQSYGNVVTTVFLVLGIFSIGASVLLIVLIFTLLATDRASELATMRAMGMRRNQIMGVFLFEGLAYNLAGALLGSLAGLGSAYLTMTSLVSTLERFGVDVERRIEPSSMLLAFSTGMLLTFLAMLVSAWRVSRVQIVAATAGEDRSESRLWLFPVGVVLVILGTLVWWQWQDPVAFYASRHPLVVPGALSLALIGVTCWAFLAAGLARRWAGIASAAASILSGAGLILIWLRALDGMPTNRGRLFDDAVTIAVGGLILILATVWTASRGIGPLLKGVDRLSSGLPSVRLIVRPAAGYLGHHHLRTGLTVAMFGTVIFIMVASLTLIDALVNAYAGRDAAVAGYELRVDLRNSQPPGGFPHGLAEAEAVSLETFDTIGGVSRVGAQVVQFGLEATGWRSETLVITEPAFSESIEVPFVQRAQGFNDDTSVWRALAEQPGAAVMTAGSLPGNPSATTGDVPLPLTIWARSEDGGQPIKLTVVGIVDPRTELDRGIYLSRETATGLATSLPAPQTYFLSVAPEVAVSDAADGLRVSFTSGLSVTDLGDSLRVSRSIRELLTRLVQGYMGLGLVAGVAALGILGVQSVIERRGQLGALRALGFTRLQTCLTLGFESFTIAALGIAGGIAAGLVLARSLVAVLASRAPEILYSVPWGQIGVTATLAAAGSAISISLAAWQAGRVSPSDALRH